MFAKDQQRTVGVAAVLILGTALLYWPVAAFDFINFDDGLYVFNNDHLKNGFSWLGLRWCFQIGYAGYWHPLTWLSHMLDCQLFGLNPGPPHIVNVLLHAFNSALLFLVLKRLTQTFWRSAMVAALFAWHPLRVESVAWVAERKDVLSALFWMLALWAYVRYAEKLKSRIPNSKFYYGLTVLFFALGLMAKPMIITLPCVLLLLDWWPLGRFAPDAPKPYSRVILEKMPLFLLAAGSGILTVIAQNKGGAVATLEFVPLDTRVLNGLVCYLRYVEKLFWPANLSVIYPLVFKLPTLEVVLALVFLAGISAVALSFWKSRPYWLVGWLWFLGVLFPVIGFVQAGGQSMADRFTYLPSIGIFIIVCWAAHDLTRGWRRQRALLMPVAALALAACAMQTNAQVRYWRNSGTLFRHALAIDPDNYIAHSSYGCYLRDLGQLEQARIECQRAVEIAPIYVMGYTFLSSVLEMEGKKEDAMAALRDGLKIRPDFSGARCDLARLLFEKNLYLEAEAELEEGLKFDPTDPGLHLFLGHALAGQGKYEAAEEQFSQGARLDPQDPAIHFQWALTLAAQRKIPGAIAQYRAALQLQPDFANALNNLAWLLAANPDPALRDGAEAVQLASRACALTHTNEAIKIETLANACAEAGRFEDAVAWAQKASEVALAHGQTNVAEQNLELQKLYQSHRPFYEYQ
jgi:tetratricopeptide (TPR) repeat protein